MSLLDANGDHIVTLDGIWSLLLKVALVSIPVILTMAAGFCVWVVMTIYTIQGNQSTLTEKVAGLNQRITDFKAK